MPRSNLIPLAAGATFPAYYPGPGYNGGRLTVSTGVAVPVSDQTAQAKIYWTPFIHGGIALPVGPTGPFKAIYPGEQQIAAPNTLFKLYDTFAYLIGGSLGLETLDWTQISATINLCVPATEVFTTTAAHGMAVGDLVGITSIVGTVGTDATSGVNGRVWRIASVPLTTTFTLSGSNLALLGYTSSGTIYRIPTVRATALTTLNGTLVKTGDATRVYLGTGMTGGGGLSAGTPTSGQTEDSEQFRLLWNHYNRTLRNGLRGESGTHTYAVAATRYANADPLNQVCIVLGLADQVLIAGCSGQVSFSVAGTTTNYGRLSCGTAAFAVSGAQAESGNTDLIRVGTIVPRVATVGLNWFPSIELIAGAGTLTSAFQRAMVSYMG